MAKDKDKEGDRPKKRLIKVCFPLSWDGTRGDGGDGSLGRGVLQVVVVGVWVFLEVLLGMLRWSI